MRSEQGQKKAAAELSRGGDCPDEAFASSAARLAGLAGALLGWRPGEFWSATPAELATVLGAMRGEAGAAATATAEDLARLMEMFPD